MSHITYRIERTDADRLLFLFHGWSAEQHHLAAYVPLVDPHGRFTAICPRAPHDLPDGDGASWFDRADGAPVAESFIAALDALDDRITIEVEAAGVGLDRCVLGGFSQGGFLALALAGRVDAPRYGGVWAMCCGLPQVDDVALDLGAAAGTPALVQYGERDAIISPERGRAVASSLADAGWVVTERGYDMAHSQTIEMMVDARTWLAELD